MFVSSFFPSFWRWWNTDSMFQPVSKYFKTVANTNKVTTIKSKGLSDKVLNLIVHAKIQAKFDGSCLKENKLIFTHKRWLIFTVSMR